MAIESGFLAEAALIRKGDKPACILSPSLPLVPNFFDTDPQFNYSMD
jgi:hypothetical protein